VIRQLSCLFGPGTVAGLDEGLLLERFASRRDEAAFEALVARFGPMVLGVCRRRLDDPHDVEDAFQATFLILVAKAATIRDGAHLGNWLYGVAYRVAERARTSTRRRRAREEAGPPEAAVAPEQPAEGERRELAAVLDEELSRLPDKYRAPLVLCSLQGETYEAAAMRLKWPIGTVRSRTARARALMRCRLVRRGFAPATGALAIALTPPSARAAVPPALAEATQAAARVVGAQAVAAGTVSAAVVDLTRGVLRSMVFTKLRMAAVTVIAIVTTATGAGVLARQVVTIAAVEKQDERPAAPRARVAAGAARPADLAPDRVKTELMEELREAYLAKSVERLESVRPDVELLTIEVDSLRNVIAQNSHEIISRYTGTQDGPEETQAASGARGTRGEHARRRMEELREAYLAKSKELAQKRREIAELERAIRDQVEGRPAARATTSAPTPGISRALEERLSRMEDKIEAILKALKGLEKE
jgi:RNA polymerase sigma-70 factor (ECF subfamily)